MQPPSKIVTAFNKQQTFLAHAHLGPDADSIGSILALKIGLESIGKVVHLFCEDDLPPYASFLPQLKTIEQTKLSTALTLPHDVYLSLDTAKWSLVTHHLPPPLPKKTLINIDHHPDNNLKTPLSWLKPQASSTAEMTYHLLKALAIDITPDIATCLTCGILQDTSIFQNTNTTPAVFRLIAQLQDQKADYNRCLTELSRSLDINDLKAWSILLKNLKLSPDKSFAWTTISYQDWQACSPSGQLGNFANAIIGRIKGTKFGAVLTESETGVIKGSVRARQPGLDVAQIAHQLNGGGHLAAAGFKLEKSLPAAEAEFLRAVSLLKSQNKL